MIAIKMYLYRALIEPIDKQISSKSVAEKLVTPVGPTDDVLTSIDFGNSRHQLPNRKLSYPTAVHVLKDDRDEILTACLML